VNGILGSREGGGSAVREGNGECMNARTQEGQNESRGYRCLYDWKQIYERQEECDSEKDESIEGSIC